MTTEICDTNRWETNCCGYTFSTKSEGIAGAKEPLVIEVYGKGYYISECLGCKKKQARVNLLTE